MGFINRDLTGIHEFTTDELHYILEKARVIKAALINKDVDQYRLAEGKDLLAALLFYENSTRTRTSFEIAAKRLGMSVTGFSGIEGTSVKKGESLRHTLDMYEAYLCDCVIMRHPLDGSARFAASHLGIPVFNAGDGKHEHPTQTLLDLFTIKEHLGRLDDFDMGIVGDLKYGRTTHSLAIALTKFQGVRLHLFSHPSLGMPSDLLELVAEHGVEVIHYESLAEMASKVDLIYQTRIQKERMPDAFEFEKAKNTSLFTFDIMKKTKPHFGLMHPLPVDKAAPSIAPVLDRHPKALYKTQAGNGVPTRLTELALALGLLGDDFRGTSWSVIPKPGDFVEKRPIINKEIRQDVSIRPIRNNGVVIDHVAPFVEEKLVRMLRVREQRQIYRAATVKSLRNPGTIKGMLMIEDRVLSDEDLKNIASVTPGCTVNVIASGEVVSKCRLHLPERIFDVPGMTCGNKGCISRPETGENVPPLMVKAAPFKVRCDYCGHVMAADQLVL